MTAGALLLMLAGLVVAGGAVGVVAAARGVSVFGPARVRRVRMRLSWRHGAAVAAGVLALLVTGWPVAGLACAGAVVFVPRMLGGAGEAKRLIATAGALAEWTRRLADLIVSGAAGSARDAVARTVASAPDAIIGPVRQLVARMAVHGLEPAARAFADQVGDPAAEKIAGVLILRDRNGGPGLADALTALAQDLDERARMIREVEAERAKPRANMRTIVTVTAVLVVGMMLFARTFLSGYSTPVGQLLLAGVAVVFTAALRWMRSLAKPPRPPRILTKGDTAVTVGR